MHAFVSYQTGEKLIAARVRQLLEDLGVRSFMAHEDIHVSQEWRLKILEEIGKADLFVPLLSARYLASPWCMQESGIAAFRNDLCIVPLSLDGTIPPGFIANVQSTKIDPENPTLADLIPGLAKRDLNFAFDVLTARLRGSNSYRSAEANFRLLTPYLGAVSEEKVVKVLEAAAENGEIRNAAECVQKHLPPLLASHGHLLKPAARRRLKERLAYYS